MEKGLLKTITLSLALLASTCVIASVEESGMSNEDSNFNWGEERAKSELAKEIKEKFGTESSLWFSWFTSAEEKEKIKAKNSDIQDLKRIVEEELRSPDNFKRVPCEETYTVYETKTVRRPVQRVITEWEEVTERIPVTATKTVIRKRWSSERLKSRLFAAIINIIAQKSYEYALRKTENYLIADMIKTEISNELMSQVSSLYASLSSYIGKEREKKIDQKIERIMREENARQANLTDNNFYEPSAPPYEYANQQ